MFKRSRVTVLAVIAIALLTLGGAAIAWGTGGGEDEGLFDDDRTERAITGDALEKASDAALRFTGGGEVTDTEVGDEESYYEVEVTMEDGRQIDVQLDEDFSVVGSEDDGSGEDD